jgi:predicted dehydrogenase
MRLAIVGTSLIAERLVSAVSECRDIETVAVYSRTMDKAERFAGTYRIPEIFVDLEALARSSAIDAVYIASPNSCHFEQSVLMMRNGKHVLCEKPISSNAEQLKQMLQVAGENNVVLLEASMHLFAPGIGLLLSLLPEIGTVRRVSLLFNQYSSRYDGFKQGVIHNAFTTERAGGALMDIGVYCVEMMVALFGKPEEVLSSSILLHTGVDGLGAIIAKYDGFLAELSYSKISQSATPSVIQGEDGSLVFDKLSIMESIDVVKRNGETRRVLCNVPENQMVYEVRAFADMIKDPEKAEPYNEISMISQTIMDVVKEQGNIILGG